ncbi:Regulatory sensor-transducer, BlaR1/MecR1 family [Winogradskyella psychrotolerans RS-3]|uniref:Regulatory sensor-transducer, BlaR1/MecR1 family n=1 Tax=Winogradskyella psychrotolerans RS-3 TaxID=641526 RepID=S7VWU0_9FLAO|nr:TonB-dependent receptor plug domain-containing protein [Winogradskyella psychrotolerans]EPR73862.1 Regulatory sensor-transducer, BlaR1/MecR1 family [Winogradskyella psychrotolerans RS-3]
MNTETVYVEVQNDIIKNTNTTEIIDAITTENIKVKFTKNMSDESLDKMKIWLKSKNVTMTIKHIKRNRNSEISNLNIDFKTENGTTNYHVKDKDGITPFEFKMDDDGSFGVEVVQNTDNIYEELIFEELNPNSNLQHNSYDSDSLEVIVEDSSYFKSRTPKHKTYIRKLNTSNSSKDTIYFSMDSLEIKNQINKKSDFYYEDGSKPKIISKEITIHNPSNKAIYNTRYDLQNPKPLLIVNGKPTLSSYLKTINPNDIESMTVLKGEDALNAYGKKGQNGVIVLTTKSNNPLKESYKNTDTNAQFPKEDNLLYILDGKEISKSDLTKVYTKETVSSISVLKEKEAKEKYGEKGTNGVVEVISKNRNDSTEDKTFIFTPEKESTKKGDPWSISYSTSYIDTEDISKSGSLVYISKTSQNYILEAQKNIMKKQGISVKYTKLKRNKLGEIISIKISLNNKEGKKSSASYRNNDGIPNIEFGIAENELIIRTSDLELDGY